MHMSDQLRERVLAKLDAFERSTGERDPVRELLYIRATVAARRLRLRDWTRMDMDAAMWVAEELRVFAQLANDPD